MQQNDKASDTVLEKGGQRETIDNAEQPGRHIEGNIQLIDAHNEIRRVPLPRYMRPVQRSPFAIR